MAADLREGTELAGYRIQVLVARGGMGVVYKATQLSLEREVALKLIAPELASQDAFRERFLREAKLAASLEHPHVLPVYEVGEVDGQLFLALRFVDGADLGSVLTRGPLSPERTRRIVTQLCFALEAAHERRLLHRDVKPENVLLLGKEGEEHAYLTDFGLAKPQSERGLTKTGELLGSLAYLAPEQIEKGQSDERSDLYSLGCLLYACLTGNPPFAREHEAAILWAHLKEPAPLPSDARPELGEAFDWVIERALAKDPADRFQTAGELAGALAVDAPAPARRLPVSPGRTNLPRPASSFVGRDRELQAVRSRFEAGARLVTLTGPGGTGKTRLALEAAASIVPEYEDGVFWVGLAALRDPALVSETISQTIGAKDGLTDWIAKRELLLLLDNLEQVIDAAPELGELLSACPNLTLLVTSRELLRISGEIEYPVPPLAEPEAVSLFCERAQVHATEAIAELCARLDNLPLAVELAAARCKALSPPQILERLPSRLDLLKGGRDSDPRQQTLRATIEWSYELLQREEQELFVRLSVFSGGCTLDAAEEVCGADLDTLQSLVEKSLLRFTQRRYWMLETIREYAGELLGEKGETEILVERLGGHLVSLAIVEGAPDFATRQAEAYARLEPEHANTRVVMESALSTGRRELAVELVTRLGQFWVIRGHQREAGEWIDAVLRDRGSTSNATWARVLIAASDVRRNAGDLAGAVEVAKEIVETMAGDASVDPLPIAAALADLSDSARGEGDLRRARDYAERSLEYRNAHGLPGTRALNSLAHVALEDGNLENAAKLFERAADSFKSVGQATNYVQALLGLAEVARRGGRIHVAVEYVTEAIEEASRLGDLAGVGDGLKVLALLASEQGWLERAGMLWGAGESIHDAGDVPELHRRLQHGQLPELPDDAIRAGVAMDTDEALEYALSSFD